MRGPASRCCRSTPTPTRRSRRIRAGLIRYIENRSDAQAAYYHGGDQQVAAGIGHWRVIKEYAGDTTFNQELRIVAIEDGISVIWDPDAMFPNKEDAKYCFVPVDMSHDAFKEKFPDAALADFEDSAGAVSSGWYGTDFVRVAEYWVKKPVRRLLALTPDGRIDDITDDDAIRRSATAPTACASRNARASRSAAT